MKTCNSREIHRFLRKSGWVVTRHSGDHFIYTKGNISMSVPKNVNRMLMQRLDKQFALGMKNSIFSGFRI